MTSERTPGPLAYLWTDLETTGLELTDDLLEVSVIATDKDLNELETFTTLVRPTRSTFVQIASKDIVFRMHESSGLLADLESERGTQAPAIWEIGDALIALLERHRDPSAPPVRLAGGGVSHFDSPYLKHWTPKFASLLHYRPLDISQVAQAYTDATGSKLFGEKTGKAHRAEADIREDLDRARQFWHLFAMIDAQISAPSLDGREAVLAGAEIIQAFDTASDDLDLAAGRARIDAALDGVNERDALAGVTAIASHLVTILAARSGITVDDVLQSARRELIRTSAENSHAPRM
ncbi:exonuclease domain-containing protein [Microbacterium gorillae]|uniref:exonuclease domain-containing protein n=1 Tax=Microbacterium gorillae TaxID=1231063 RepID=UPI003D999A57